MDVSVLLRSPSAIRLLRLLLFRCRLASVQRNQRLDPAPRQLSKRRLRGVPIFQPAAIRCRRGNENAAVCFDVDTWRDDACRTLDDVGRVAEDALFAAARLLRRCRRQPAQPALEVAQRLQSVSLLRHVGVNDQHTARLAGHDGDACVGARPVRPCADDGAVA